MSTTRGRNEVAGETPSEPPALAAAGWPGVARDVGRLRRHLEERLGDETLAQALRNRRLDDLALACACFHGDEAAIEAFQQAFGPAMRHAIARATPISLRADVYQQLLARLFVRGESEPAIGGYRGRGKLSTWLQVVARREAHNATRKPAAWREVPRPDDDVEAVMDSVVDSVTDPLGRLKDDYRQRFKRAFAEAFATLSPRERNLLRYECVEGLDRDRIAALYGVSRATVARWRASCRRRLFEQTRRGFVTELALPSGEFASVVRLIESQLEVSLSRLLAPSTARDRDEATRPEPGKR